MLPRTIKAIKKKKKEKKTKTAVKVIKKKERKKEITMRKKLKLLGGTTVWKLTKQKF